VQQEQAAKLARPCYAEGVRQYDFNESAELNVNTDQKTGNGRKQRRTYVYIVECCDGTYYTGLAIDVKERLGLHNSGMGAKYTRSRLPVKLVHVETCVSLSDALKREHRIKQMKRGQKEALVLGGRGLPKKFRALRG
jgi:putative endonuclease